MKVAIACSGLGHVARGIEAWAQDTFSALHRRDVTATIFGGASLPDLCLEVLPCFKRTGFAARVISAIFRHLGGWRYGLGSPYEVEQTSFAFRLWWRIRLGYDILHVQDPAIASVLDRFFRLGLSRPRVILANGTGEMRVADRLSVVQELTPEAARQRSIRRSSPQSVFVIPNFVDQSRFAPGDRERARVMLGLPSEAFVVLTCAALRKVHKRIDYLLDEFAAHAGRPAGEDSFLVVAGAREENTQELLEYGKRLLGRRVHFLVNYPRNLMPDVYRAADVFVLPSLSEPFGIVLLEAMATGLPVICHETGTFRYIGGPAGIFEDLSRSGTLAAALDRIVVRGEHMGFAAKAVAHVRSSFSEEIVAAQIIDMYSGVLQRASVEAVPDSRRCRRYGLPWESEH